MTSSIVEYQVNKTRARLRVYGPVKEEDLPALDAGAGAASSSQAPPLQQGFLRWLAPQLCPRWLQRWSRRLSARPRTLKLRRSHLSARSCAPSMRLARALVSCLWIFWGEVLFLVPVVVQGKVLHAAWPFYDPLVEARTEQKYMRLSYLSPKPYRS